MTSIYIAGPMRGYPEFNFPAFFSAEWTLREIYETVHNPARRDIESGISVMGTKGDMSELPESFSLREAMTWNCETICKCTHIYMLKNWEQSSGARAEHALAVCLGLTIVYQ